MTALPTKSEFTGSEVKQDAFKDALDDLHDYLDGLLASTGTTSDARLKLGLGSAATRNVGTGGSDLPTNSQVSTSIGGLLGSGTKTVFYQLSPPVGWAQDTSFHDQCLRVVNTTNEGGTTGGSWTISGLSGSVSVAYHTLSVNEIQGHNHGGGNHQHTLLDAALSVGSGFNPPYGTTFSNQKRRPRNDNPINYSGDIVAWQGGNAGHTHPGSTATINQNGAWRPAYASFVVGVKS